MIDGKEKMKAIKISEDVKKILDNFYNKNGISPIIATQEKLKFQISITNMYVNAAHAKCKKPCYAKELMEQIFKAKKFMEYAYLKVNNFLYDNKKFLEEKITKNKTNILMIDLENIINIYRDYEKTETSNSQIYNIDRELIVNIILDYIYYLYGDNILPIFCINNLGRIVEPIVKITRTYNNGEINYIRIVANVNKGELDDYFLAQFCIVLGLKYPNKFNYFIFTFDNMRWWFAYKPNNLCFVYFDEKKLLAKRDYKMRREDTIINTCKLLFEFFEMYDKQNKTKNKRRNLSRKPPSRKSIYEEFENRASKLTKSKAILNKSKLTKKNFNSLFIIDNMNENSDVNLLTNYNNLNETIENIDFFEKIIFGNIFDVEKK